MAAEQEMLSGSVIRVGGGDNSWFVFSQMRELSKRERLQGLSTFCIAFVIDVFAKLSKADTPKRDWNGLP